MPSVRADRSSRPRPARAGRRPATRSRPGSTTGLLGSARGVLGVLLALLLVAGCSDDVSIDPPQPTATDQRSTTAGVQDALADLTEALASGDGDRATDLATPQAGGLLRSIVANVRDLGLVDVDLRFVAEGPPLDDTEAGAYPPGAVLAVVDVRYRIADRHRRAVKSETTVVVVPEGDGEVGIAGFGPQGDRTPLWLTGRLTARSAGRALVIASGAERADQLLPLARRALREVNALLPRWRGPLVIEAPNSTQALNAALSADPQQYANIAAVTTTVDGSLAPDSPVHVFVNPAVFDGLGPRGSQVVVTHEATHVATEATFSSIPRWLIEGFADFVALDRAGVPLRTAAAQILAEVRKEGPPKELPDPSDLDPSATGLGATYELAWLACRFIGEQYGDAKMVAFYDAVDDGRTLGQAFRQVLGTTQEDFVDAWSRDVAALAGVAG